MALRETLEEVRAAIKSGDANGANEQEAKAWFITPIVEALGWRGRSRVRFEYSPDQASRRMDYALRGPDQKTVALIEAKAPGQDLERHVTQTLNYAFLEGIPLCVLSTGVEWWLYLSHEEASAPHQRCFAKLDVGADGTDTLEDRLQHCLGYAEVVDGSALERARQLLEEHRSNERVLAEIPRAWERMLKDPDDLLIEMVQAEVYNEIKLRPTDQQVSEFLQRPTPASRQTPATERSTRQQAPIDLSNLGQPRPNPRSGNNRPVQRIVGFRLWGRQHQARTAVEVWLGVAKAVLEQHPNDFERAFQLRGRTRQYIARSSDEHTQSQEIGSSGYYAETNFRGPECIQRARDLLRLFGYGETDLEVLEA